ncbi:MAG: L,D-transpeptidase [Polyangiaceae bacterium]
MRARRLLAIPALLLPAAGVFLTPTEHLQALASMLPASVISPSAKPPAQTNPKDAAPPIAAAASPQKAPTPAGTTAAPANAAPDSSASPNGGTAMDGAPSTDGSDPAAMATLPAALIDDGSDDLPDLEPKDLDPVAPKDSDAPSKQADSPAPQTPKKEGPVLASTARETWVFAEPRWNSRKLGYLRAGAVVSRKAKPAGWSSCPDGWYRIEPKGYVCVGPMATTDTNHPVVVASSKRPTFDGLPYVYAMGRFPPPPLYTRLPTRGDMLKVEPDLASILRKAGALAKDPSYVAPPEPDALPAFLTNNALLPPLANTVRGAEQITQGRARVRSGFALLGTYEHEGRKWGMTTDLTLLPLDRVRMVKPSAFHGIKLDDDVTLPVVFTRSKHAMRYSLNEAGGLGKAEPLAWREAVPVTETLRKFNGTLYYQAKDGTFVNSEQVVRVEKYHKAPAWATAGRKWIDVSILRQALVAYEGEKPVYVTLVSTGADGTGDPKKTHSTIQGAFLIHTKHTTVTMDGDTVGDEFDFRDVPFVQYFTEGFALHAAYWHDEFGTPRSHGCVNLAPIDAAYLFGWTDPVVPEGWHAALSLKRGTLVYTHP